MILNKDNKNNEQIDEMFSVGAHFGYNRSRRHPSVFPFIFGRKNNVEIFDLEKVAEKLEEAKAFVESVTKEGKQVLFVSGKPEAQSIIKSAAEKIDMPYVSGRWIGGTLTNFSEIRKRVEYYLKLISEKEKGDFAKYTKKERLDLDKEIIKLESRFDGITGMDKKPGAVFIIDADKEEIARNEANQNKIPVISLSSSDCDFSKIDYVIPANDSGVESIKYFVNEIVKACEEGTKKRALQ